MKLSLPAIILICLSFDAFSQLKEAPAIDKIFAKWDTKDSPGCAVGIFRDGKIIFSKGYGMANLDYNIANSAASVFDLASTSKQFTAACIMLLVEQGKLNLHDKIRDFFPELRENTAQITVQHLLHHTSGIRDYLTLAYYKGLGDVDYYDDTEVMNWLCAQNNLNFPAGEEFLYSNSGYWLLGQIVNKVSGMHMSEFARKEIFEPLGMTNTRFQTDMNDIIKNRATGYEPHEEAGFKISMTPLDLIGDGGIYSSIEDLKKWDDAFYHSKVFSKNFWAGMTKTGQLNNGKDLDYAAGLMIGKYKGLEIISHGGAFVGFRSDMIRFPEHKFTVVILCNRADANPSALCFQIADIFLENKFIPESNSGNPGSVSEVLPPDEAFPFQNLIGKYELKPGLDVIVSIENDSIHIVQNWNNAAYNLAKKSGNSFQLPDNAAVTFTFSDKQDGFAQKLSVNQNGKISNALRKKEMDIAQIDLTIYEGYYSSSELNTIYNIFLKDNTLQLRQGKNDPIALSVHDMDKFTAPGILISFKKIGGHVHAFDFEAGRIKNIAFNKISE